MQRHTNQGGFWAPSRWVVFASSRAMWLFLVDFVVKTTGVTETCPVIMNPFPPSELLGTAIMSRAVLVELYEATNGTGDEADRANWLTGEPCADAWEGVTRVGNGRSSACTAWA